MLYTTLIRVLFIIMYQRFIPSFITKTWPTICCCVDCWFSGCISETEARAHWHTTSGLFKFHPTLLNVHWRGCKMGKPGSLRVWGVVWMIKTESYLWWGFLSCIGQSLVQLRWKLWGNTGCPSLQTTRLTLNIAPNWITTMHTWCWSSQQLFLAVSRPRGCPVSPHPVQGCSHRTHYSVRGRVRRRQSPWRTWQIYWSDTVTMWSIFSSFPEMWQLLNG